MGLRETQSDKSEVRRFSSQKPRTDRDRYLTAHSLVVTAIFVHAPSPLPASRPSPSRTNRPSLRLYRCYHHYFLHPHHYVSNVINSSLSFDEKRHTKMMVCEARATTSALHGPPPYGIRVFRDGDENLRKCIEERVHEEEGGYDQATHTGRHSVVARARAHRLQRWRSTSTAQHMTAVTPSASNDVTTLSSDLEASIGTRGVSSGSSINSSNS